MKKKLVWPAKKSCKVNLNYANSYPEGFKQKKNVKFYQNIKIKIKSPEDCEESYFGNKKLKGEGMKKKADKKNSKVELNQTGFSCNIKLDGKLNKNETNQWTAV